MFWHIDADIISLIVMMAIHVYNLYAHPKKDTTLQGRCFNRCVNVGVFTTLVDIAASIIMEVPCGRILYHFLMTLYFLAVEFAMVIWFFYAISIVYHDNGKRGARAVAAVIIPFVLFAVVACSNPWTGVIYSLGEDNSYTRGPLFALMMVLFALYAIAMLIMILLRRKHIFKGQGVFTVALMPVIMTASIIVQLCVPGWLMILPGYMICVVIAFLFLQNEKSRSNRKQLQLLSKSSMTDALTGLLNRAGADAMLRRSLLEDVDEGCIIAVLDLDDLKSINDVLGHANGDVALKTVGAHVKRHFRDTDVVARYGGDEFLIFLPGAKSQAQLEDSFRSLVEEISRLRIGDEDQYPLHVSIGAAFGTVGVDSFEQLMERADTALYHVKCYGKNGYAFYHPGMSLDKEQVRQRGLEEAGDDLSAEPDDGCGGEKRHTLLVADDSDMNRALLSGILKNHYTILEAADGRQALDILNGQAERISCVLLDIVMPVIDGYAVLKQMRESEALAKIPVIVTTANSDVEAEVRALSFGAQDFVAKPYTPAVVRHRVDNLIALSEMTSIVGAMGSDTPANAKSTAP